MNEVKANSLTDDQLVYVYHVFSKIVICTYLYFLRSFKFLRFSNYHDERKHPMS